MQGVQYLQGNKIAPIDIAIFGNHTPNIQKIKKKKSMFPTVTQDNLVYHLKHLKQRTEHCQVANPLSAVIYVKIQIPNPV